MLSQVKNQFTETSNIRMESICVSASSTCVCKPSTGLSTSSKTIRGFILGEMEDCMDPRPHSKLLTPPRRQSLERVLVQGRMIGANQRVALHCELAFAAPGEGARRGEHFRVERRCRSAFVAGLWRDEVFQLGVLLPLLEHLLSVRLDLT